MRRRGRNRLLAGIVGVSLLAGAGAAPSVQMTDAAFTDSEHVSSSTFTALNVPEPISSTTPGCVASSGLLGANPQVTVNWRVPAGVAGYTKDNAEYGQISNQGLLEPILSNLLGNVSTTGTPAAYVTVINGGLLTGLLGATKTFGIRFIGPGGWRSDWLVATASIGLLGANPQCTMSTAPST